MVKEAKIEDKKDKKDKAERKRAIRLINLSTFKQVKYARATFDGEWRDLVGDPVLTGIWIIWGESSNGKTSAAIKMLRYLCKFKKCIYWSKEEGMSDTLQTAMDRENWTEAEEKKIFIPQNDYSLTDLVNVLRQPKSPDIIFMDSLQIFAKLYSPKFYYDLKEEFGDKKLFIFISQADGKEPKGTIGDDVKYDANVKMRVEGGKLTSRSRIKNSVHGSFIIINEALYNEYWR